MQNSGCPKSVQSSLKVPKDEELEGSMKRLEVRTVNRGFDGQRARSPNGEELRKRDPGKVKAQEKV